jgi:hypothetical protein
MQANAAASIAEGGWSYDNAHKLVWGFNQGKTRHLLDETTKVHRLQILALFPF